MGALGVLTDAHFRGLTGRPTTEMERDLPELNTVIRTFANEVDAHLAQAVLDANGIDSNLIRDDAGGMMPWLQWLHPIRLVVREADSIEAVELLDSPPGPMLIP
jgi:hypothetical protein